MSKESTCNVGESNTTIFFSTFPNSVFISLSYRIGLTPTMVHLVSFQILLYMQKDSRIFTLLLQLQETVYQSSRFEGFLLSLRGREREFCCLKFEDI